MSATRSSDDVITLAHGSGGELSHELVEQVFLRHFANPTLQRLDDSATVPLAQLGGTAADGAKLAFTTDSYVISPIFFPGGDIGKLAVCGTVNDLAMSGATPLYLSSGYILEEGLPLAQLEQIVASMARTAQDAGVQIVTGDTKVVDHGNADKVFINTAGVGIVPAGVELGSDLVQPGDVVLVSGTLGDHGMTIMSQREGLRFDTPLQSDCAPLNGLVAAMLEAVQDHPGAIHCLRDPTRGGITSALNEVASKSQIGIEIEEPSVPVRQAVRSACELLGLDPLYVANEGKLVAFVAPEAAEAILEAMQGHPLGRDAALIGHVSSDHPGRVVLRTPLGARRILDMMVGEQLPRIC